MAILLSCQSLRKSYGTQPLFQDITLGISQGERMGLIGPNGSGKSTLLRILAGVEPSDAGEVSRRRDLRLVYLPQEDVFPPEATVEEVLTEALRGETLEEYERAAQRSMVLAKVGFMERDQAAGTLSGGWRKRLALARALIQNPDLLLLDEPTNHLDLDGVLWLESLLTDASFAFVLVTHDRYFLENATNRIVELGRAYPDGYLSVEGVYSDFLLRKEEFLDAQAQREHALSGQVNREIAWLRRGAQARTTKAKYRIEAAGRLIDDLAELKTRNAQDRTAAIDFTATNRQTRELMVVKDIEKRLGGKRLFSQLNLTLTPGRKLGLIGPNGSGKTTLLRLLAGEIEPDQGAIRRAEGLRIVRFDQDRALPDRRVSLRRALSPNGETVVYRGGSIHISAWAKRFLFQPPQLDLPVESLSGGEQARVLIARLMLQPADVLILDEPTNDLDIPSMEVLEESLTDFPGAIVLVTHDRYLLDRVSTELFALDGSGGTAFFADYAQWERERESRLVAVAVPKQTSKQALRAPKPTSGLSVAERRELSRMEETIMAAEEEVTALQREMETPAVSVDHMRLQACWEAVQAAQEKVAQLYARWEELEARRNSP